MFVLSRLRPCCVHWTKDIVLVGWNVRHPRTQGPKVALHKWKGRCPQMVGLLSLGARTLCWRMRTMKTTHGAKILLWMGASLEMAHVVQWTTNYSRAGASRYLQVDLEMPNPIVISVWSCCRIFVTVWSLIDFCLSGLENRKWLLGKGGVRLLLYVCPFSKLGNLVFGSGDLLGVVCTTPVGLMYWYWTWI